MLYHTIKPRGWSVKQKPQDSDYCVASHFMPI